MKRMVTAAALMAAVWMLAAGHVDATTTNKATHHQSTCSKINAALKSGQSMQSVEKQFKVSSKTVHKCQEQKTASSSTAHPQRSSSQAH
ncbi:hypothetical protein KF840_19955 [bacterium]|nr:hypothetical protein [bacterium]